MRNRASLIVAAVVGVLLILLLKSVFSDNGETTADGDPAVAPRDRCTPLVVASSTEKSGLLAEIADEYEATDGTVDGQCVDVQVVGKASGDAEEALARGWDERMDGPLPDVWTPAASTWLGLLREDLTRADRPSLIDDENPSIAKTPLVLAMPQPMAEALGWPDTPIGWGDILDLGRSDQGWAAKGHPEWGQFKLGKTNPTLSTSGLAATVGLFFAATGKSSDLTAADLDSADVRAFVADVESSVVHYGDTTLTFLANLQRADDSGQGLSYVSAVAVEEKSVIDFNLGNPTGNPENLGDHAPPRVPAVAIYPKEGTLYSDNPYAVLTAPWVDAAKQAAAADFLDYLLTDAVQRQFTDAGFRDASGNPGRALQESQAVIVEQPAIELSPPAPAILAGVRDTWLDLRKKARVLLVLDVSGSMGEPAGDAGETKLELAKTAAIAALEDFSEDDEVGVWAFTTDIGDDVYQELAPVARLGDHLDAVRQSIESLVPLNGTPLYAVTRRAVGAMAASADAERINAVVLLTDGRNEYPADTDLDSLVRSLATSENTAGAVRVFSIGYGADADLDALRQISEASRAAAYDATDPASLERIFTAVVSNF